MRVQPASWPVPTFGQLRVKQLDSGEPLWHISKAAYVTVPALSEWLCSHAVTKLGKALFPLFAEALDQSPDFFEDKVQRTELSPDKLILLR